MKYAPQNLTNSMDPFLEKHIFNAYLHRKEWGFMFWVFLFSSISSFNIHIFSLCCSDILGLSQGWVFGVFWMQMFFLSFSPGTSRISFSTFRTHFFCPQPWLRSHVTYFLPQKSFLDLSSLSWVFLQGAPVP